MEHRLFGAAYSLFLAFAAWVLLVLIVSGVQGGPLKEATWVATLSLCGISTLVVLALFIHGLLKRGEVIEDCGPHPLWKHSAVTSALLVFGFLISFATQKANEGTLLTLPCMITIFLCTAVSRLQVCQNGLLLYTCLIQWDQIKAYEWAEDGSLLIKRTSRLPQPRMVVPVPADRRAVIEQALGMHCKKEISTSLHPDF